MADEPDPGWLNKRRGAGWDPFDSGQLIVVAIAAGVYIAVALLFPHAPGYARGAAALGAMFVGFVYRLLKSPD